MFNATFIFYAELHYERLVVPQVIALVVDLALAKTEVMAIVVVLVLAIAQVMALAVALAMAL